MRLEETHFHLTVDRKCKVDAGGVSHLAEFIVVFYLNDCMLLLFMYRVRCTRAYLWLGFGQWFAFWYNIWTIFENAVLFSYTSPIHLFSKPIVRFLLRPHENEAYHNWTRVYQTFQPLCAWFPVHHRQHMHTYNHTCNVELPFHLTCMSVGYETEMVHLVETHTERGKKYSHQQC